MVTVVHQVNLKRGRPEGFARSLSEREPRADIFADGTNTGMEVGQCLIQRIGSKEKERYVAHLGGQHERGKARNSRQPGETDEARERWAEEAIGRACRWAWDESKRTGKKIKVMTVEGLGCGLAGGNTLRYEGILRRAAIGLEDGITQYVDPSDPKKKRLVEELRASNRGKIGARANC